MRLLFISSVFPNPLEPTKGVFNEYLVRAMARQHNVEVVSPVSWVTELRCRNRPTAAWRSRPFEDGATTIHHPRYYYPPWVLRATYGHFYWQSIRKTVAQICRSHRPDAVIGYWAHPDGAAAVRVARQLGAPAVVMVGGSDVLVVTRNAARRRCVARALVRADGIVTVSRHLVSKINALGVPSENVHLWQRGVDPSFTPGCRAAARERLGLQSGQKVILWVGRLVPVKGLEVLIDACATLTTNGICCRVCLIGDGPLRKSLEATVFQRGLGRYVSFLGLRRNDELPDWYRAADLTVLSSWSEGVPNVLRESLACGTPFVATSVGGVAELAEAHSDWLVEPGDSAALASAIERSLSMSTPPGDLPKMSTCEDSAKSLVRIIRHVVDRKSGAVAPGELGPYAAIDSR